MNKPVRIVKLGTVNDGRAENIVTKVVTTQYRIVFQRMLVGTLT